MGFTASVTSSILLKPGVTVDFINSRFTNSQWMCSEVDGVGHFTLDGDSTKLESVLLLELNSVSGYCFIGSYVEMVDSLGNLWRWVLGSDCTFTKETPHIFWRSDPPVALEEDPDIEDSPSNQYHVKAGFMSDGEYLLIGNKVEHRLTGRVGKITYVYQDGEVEIEWDDTGMPVVLKWGQVKPASQPKIEGLVYRLRNLFR